MASNKATKINLLPVKAVRKCVCLSLNPHNGLDLLKKSYGARIFNAQKSASIAAARQTCISINRNNHDQTRMRRAVTRASKRKTYREEHDDIGESIVEAEQDLVAAARLKELKSQKKELGRVPRHSTSGRTAQSTSSIPRLVRSADQKSESDVEFSGSSSPLPPSSPVRSSSPRLRLVDDDDMFPAGISAPTESPSSDLLAPDLETPISDSTEPLFTFTEQDLAKIFGAMPAFETPIATQNSSEESQTFLLPADPLAPPPE
ncbi:hypothetical protein DFH09DRAFT_1152815 [Mycena vulgaris]|nr:hypothetical protein DFH09DRAFT_1152815 [Mycena vulgaris]